MSTENTASDGSHHEGIRDTIESIVVAFILAFVFRAFVVEAFVIPTGSMAPGLYGLNAQHRCEMCHYAFVYGIREPARNADGRIVAPGTLDTTGFAVRCPNCGWSGAGNADLNRSTKIAADSGDRILVHKWTYDIGGPILGPKRWDVVVFKNPEDGDTNFIKRLLGLPGEVLEIIDGDIYTAPIDSLPQDIVAALSQPPVPGNSSASRLSAEQERELVKHYRIQRKAEVAQKSLWMIHYDHDFPAQQKRINSAPNYSPPTWQPVDAQAEKAWSADSPIVRFAAVDNKQHWLVLGGHPIQDHYGYNDVLAVGFPASMPLDVGDVRVKFVLVPSFGNGTIAVSLGRGHDEFRATMGTDGQVILERVDQGAKSRPNGRLYKELGRTVIPGFVADRPMVVEFQNLDYRVTLIVNDKEIISTTDEQYRPDLSRIRQRPYQDGRDDRASVKIAGQGFGFELRHMVVHRDVFYRNAILDDYVVHGQRNRYAQYPGWGTATNPLLLRREPGEYFCCGDNSPQSKDGRLWWDVAPFLKARGDYSYGTVPEDQLIGRAFFVYWPGGLRLSKDTFPIVPNVGRMRIIR